LLLLLSLTKSPYGLIAKFGPGLVNGADRPKREMFPMLQKMSAFLYEATLIKD
jgi:hypothetical protein